MVTLCKTDLEKVILFLREAAAIHAASPSTRRRNKARMINLLIKKLGSVGQKGNPTLSTTKNTKP